MLDNAKKLTDYAKIMPENFSKTLHQKRNYARARKAQIMPESSIEFLLKLDCYVCVCLFVCLFVRLVIK